MKSRERSQPFIKVSNKLAVPRIGRVYEWVLSSELGAAASLALALTGGETPANIFFPEVCETRFQVVIDALRTMGEVNRRYRRGELKAEIIDDQNDPVSQLTLEEVAREGRKQRFIQNP